MLSASHTTVAAGLLGGLVAAWWFSRRQPSRELGAWAGRAALANPAGALAAARAVGLDRLDVMVNDGSAGAVQSVPWHLYVGPDELRAAVRLWRAGGLRVSLTSWALPAEDWIVGIAGLRRLCRELGADLTLDVEEAWLTPLRAMSPDARAAWSRRLVDAATPYDATVIVFTDQNLAAPVLAGARSIIPQAYATIRNAGRLSAGELEAAAVERFKRWGRRLVMGAAAWNLGGAYGLGDLDAARASLQAAVRLGVPRVRYWRLEWLAPLGGGASTLGAVVRDEWARLKGGA